MAYLTQRTHKLVAFAAALAITAFLQGTMLAGFDHMASESSPVVLASCEQHATDPATQSAPLNR